MPFKLELVWTFNFLLMIIHNSTAGILPPIKLVRDEGEDVVFNFTTSDSILAANFGIKKSDECDDMLKLIIVTTKGVTNGGDLDSASGRQYKNRVNFIGNISLGRAWFRLKNVSVDDEDVYAACIRQVTDEIRIMHKVELSVKPSTKRESSTLTPSASSTEGFSKLTTSSSCMPVSIIWDKEKDDINECASNPCKNGGKCTDEYNRYKCTCVAGWTGDTCETNINECKPNPCKNGGSCQDQVNGYQCTCTAGWTGDQCETSNQKPPFELSTELICVICCFSGLCLCCLYIFVKHHGLLIQPLNSLRRLCGF